MPFPPAPVTLATAVILVFPVKPELLVVTGVDVVGLLVVAGLTVARVMLLDVQAMEVQEPFWTETVAVTPLCSLWWRATLRGLRVIVQVGGGLQETEPQLSVT